MLPFAHQLAFVLFALVTGAFGVHGFLRLYRRIRAGRADTDLRFDRLPRRIWYALVTTLTQSRTFRTRRIVGLFHSFIFYGFTFYLLVNLVDAIDGFHELPITSANLPASIYILFADVLSALVLLGVIALVIRRFLLPSRTDFRFNERTVLHKDLKARYVTRDSILVSSFILFHVGSRAIGAGAKLAIEGPDRFAPFATLLSHLFTPQNALGWRIFGYWGALGSVLAFLAYFPYSKHIHIFMAPMKYLVQRPVSSGVLPAVVLNLETDLEAEQPKLGAKNLEDLAWPRLLDAYACIQCNRCQDVCPATATGKSLSPSALEINKRMELNDLTRTLPGFERGAPSPNPLLSFALSPEAAWACTTCGACIDICPVGDEPMLDIVDMRRQQVMMEGEFPAQLQTAFRGMERAKNPWGINHEKRMDWAEGLNVRMLDPDGDQHPEPDVLFWVGCAAAYDPQSQKTARAFVQLLDHAKVDFAVLGKRECCTGDTARRAGNEYLYQELAQTNIATLTQVKPKLIVATCPHCMNAVGKEYKQLGGDFKVIHHTEYLASLVADGRLQAAADPNTGAVAFHDPCYLGRHNGTYDAPRNVLNILSNSVVELPRNRENSFCCGAGGAQFWKEEEPGDERISDNRYREAQATLAAQPGPNGANTLAVGCPFCKSMLDSTPGKGESPLIVRDVAELLWEGVQRKAGVPDRALAMPAVAAPKVLPEPAVAAPVIAEPVVAASVAQPALATAELPASLPATMEPKNAPAAVVGETRRKWTPKAAAPAVPPVEEAKVALPDTAAVTPPAAATPRKVWAPKRAEAPVVPPAADASAVVAAPVEAAEPVASPAPARKAWKPKSSTPPASTE